VSPRVRRTATNPNVAVGYLRCSTERQDLSPDAQRAAITAWAGRDGVTILSWHEDLAVSGATPLEDRPGLLAAIEAVRAEGAGVLVVAKRDRLARDVLTAALVERLCERAGARVLAADGTGNGDGPEAQLLRTLLDAFAAYERALIRARTRAALAVKKARGERTGGVPMGSRVASDGRLEVDGVEAAAVARARALRAEGKSLRAIAAVLDAEGHRPRRTKWHVETLSRIVAKI
jgi:DNA invertase Pin-like site-specific DNA recombinase